VKPQALAIVGTTAIFALVLAARGLAAQVEPKAGQPYCESQTSTFQAPFRPGGGTDINAACFHQLE